MAELPYIIDENILTGIANAVRAKTGISNQITLEDAAELIQEYLYMASGEVSLVGDGRYNVADAETAVVQANADPANMLYYEYNESDGTITITVNPNVNMRYTDTTIDKILGDLYIGRMQRGYTTPLLPGSDWLMTYLNDSLITDYAGYCGLSGCPAWYFYQRAKMGESYTTLPADVLGDTTITLSQNWDIIDENNNVVGGVTSSYNGASHIVTSEYQFNTSSTTTTYIQGTTQRYVISSNSLPAGTYRFSISASWSGDSWSGSWPVEATISFSGGLNTAQSRTITSGQSTDFVISPEYPIADRVVISVNPISANSSFTTSGTAHIIQNVTVSLQLLTKATTSGNAQFSDVLRYADTLDRYSLRTMGAYYPLLLIDPQESSIPGYPVNGNQYQVRSIHELDESDDITILTNLTQGFTNETSTGTQYTVNSMRVRYVPNATITEYLSSGHDGITTSGDYKAYSYTVHRKESADG